MGSYKILKVCLLTTIILLSISLENTSATRVLLQRGPVKGSQKNPCSTVAGRSRGRCTLGEIHVAGHLNVAQAPPQLIKNEDHSISKEEVIIKTLTESDKHIHSQK
jgi:hypothetical protein